MAAHYVCDYCGEELDDREAIHVYALGGRGSWPSREYHASPCMGLVSDILENATGDRPPSPKEKREAQFVEWRAQQAKWRALSYPQREHLLVELIGENRMAVSELAERVQDKFGPYSVCYSDVYPVLQRLRASRELTRCEEPFRGTRTRSVYFRRNMAGPIVDLDRAFDKPTDEES